jgi:anti-sigma B factor antagonist
METVISERGGTCVCAVTGDIDMYTAPNLHKKYLETAARLPNAPFILDIQRSDYLDSSGIGILMQIHSDSLARKVPFCITGVHGMVAQLMKLSRMALVLPIEKTLEDAIARTGRNQ